MIPYTGKEGQEGDAVKEEVPEEEEPPKQEENK